MEPFLSDDLLPLAPAPEEDIIEEKLIEENREETVAKLDYKIKDMEGRAQLVQRIIEETPEDKLTKRYLEIMGDYIMGALTKEERKSKLYMTDNRRLTVDKREVSYEGLVEKFENGEDGLFNLIVNDKNILLTPKISITDEDIATIPGMRELRDNIAEVERQAKAATGKRKYLLKKQIIEMCRDQYVLKSIFRPAQACTPGRHGSNRIDLSEHRWIDSSGEPQSDGLITFFNPDHVSALLCNFHALKLETRGKFSNDFYYLIEDFETLMEKVLIDYPVYYDIVKMKMDGKQNVDIQKMLKEKHNIYHTVEYISSLWRNKIPKLIAEQEKENFLLWYYTFEEKGQWKKCSKCGQIKLAHNRFFSKNNTAKDGWYSQCKACRNSKNKK